MAKIDEVLTEVRLITTKLYGENGFEGDIPEIKSKLHDIRVNRALDRTDIDKNRVKLEEHDGFFRAMPYNKRWFWVIVAILILGLSGVNLSGIDLASLFGG